MTQKVILKNISSVENWGRDMDIDPDRNRYNQYEGHSRNLRGRLQFITAWVLFL